MTAKHYLVIAALVFIALIANTAYDAKPVRAQNGFETNLGYGATTTTQVFVAGSTRIAATTTNPLDPINSYSRVYANICNPSANLVYLRFDSDKQAASSTAIAVIGAAAGYSTCYEINDRNMYNGSIQASSTVSAWVNVSQYVQ